MCWDDTTRRARLWRRQSRRRQGLWKRRGVEKSKSRLSHPAWKSRKRRGIPTFPQPRRRLVNLFNRTFHVLLKPDLLTCYRHREARFRLPRFRIVGGSVSVRKLEAESRKAIYRARANTSVTSSGCSLSP